MPDLMDRLYCSEQIHIPPTFPFIMKLYCKAAIRTQPYDLLKWSAAYFRALANGEVPPVKDRIEYPPYDSPTGLSPGYIKVLIKQLGKDPDTEVTAQTLFVKWNCVCLDDELLVKLLALMGARIRVNWLKFVAVACGFICSSLTSTMVLVCEVLTDEPEGGMATIPLEVFVELYAYLAAMECGPLTEEELKQLEEAGSEEDASVVAEKIRGAVYGEEEAEELAPEEAVLEEPAQGELQGEDATPGEAEEEPFKARSVVEADEPLEAKEPEPEEGGSESVLTEATAEEETSEKDEDAESAEISKNEEESSEERIEMDESQKPKTSRESLSLENEQVIKEQALGDLEETPQGAKETGEEKVEERERPARKIVLSDIEETIRERIREKLGEEEESGKSEEEFEQLGSSLLDASARSRGYTAEELGYRLFRRYLRQEVPGIGPGMEESEVEKVIDFMDYNAHKQGGMVMPRNIRHWMCPPLDKMPPPPQP